MFFIKGSFMLKKYNFPLKIPVWEKPPVSFFPKGETIAIPEEEKRKYGICVNKQNLNTSSKK